MSATGKFKVEKINKKEGYILVTYFNYEGENLTQKGVSKEDKSMWESTYNLPLPVNEEGFLKGEKLIKHLEKFYPWDYFKSVNLRLKFSSMADNDEGEDLLPANFEGQVIQKEKKEEVKHDLNSPFGSEKDVSSLKHIIYETLEDLGFIK
jgi:hypothetical protein